LYLSISPITNDAFQIQSLAFRLSLPGGKIDGNCLRECQDLLPSMEMMLPVFCFDLGCNLRRDFFFTFFIKPPDSIACNCPCVVPVTVTFKEFERHRLASIT